MASNRLHKQAAQIREFLLKQGFLDEQFIQLEELEDMDNPNFVEEIVTLFFRDSVRQIGNMETALEKRPLDFYKLDLYMHQFKGSCSGIGAVKVRDQIARFRLCCKEADEQGCLISFEEMKKELSILKQKLECYFQTMRQAGPVETASRPK